MLRASIFQKNILSKSDKSEFAEGFQNCLIEIDDKSIVIYENEKIILKSQLVKFEDEFHTSSYKGKFADNEPFRIIRPKGFVLENVRNEHNCISAFSIASINPDGFAIHFILTNIDDTRNIKSIDKGKDEQIQRLIDGCVLALQNGLYQNFVDYSKRILTILKEGSDLIKYQNGDKILKIMRNNEELYTFIENSKIIK